MQTIPMIRKKLLKVAKDMRENAYTIGLDTEDDFSDPSVVGPTTKTLRQARRIESLVRQMHRRKAVRRAAIEHAHVTPALRRQIKTYAISNPRMSYAKIGIRFNVSIGRVSEAVAGKLAAAS